MSSESLDSDIFDTPEKSLARLQAIESSLALALGISGSNIREQLIALDRAGSLVEDELVSNWLRELAWYNDWLENPRTIDH